MISAMGRLRSLSVSHVMARDVLNVSAHQSMNEVARQFVDNGVSAAPVVNEQGQCIGILSATDFLKRERPQEQNNGALTDVADHRLVGECESGPWRIDSPPNDLVCKHMTSATQTVATTTPLLAAAAIMCAEHIHRLLVLDEQARPVGVISTMDVMAALLNAIDENVSANSRVGVERLVGQIPTRKEIR